MLLFTFHISLLINLVQVSLACDVMCVIVKLGYYVLLWLTADQDEDEYSFDDADDSFDSDSDFYDVSSC